MYFKYLLQSRNVCCSGNPVCSNPSSLLHCALSCGAVYCNRPSLFVFVCLSVCYHDNSKLLASTLTKLGLKVKVVTVSSWVNFGRPAPPGRGSEAGKAKTFGSALLQPARSVCVASERFFHCSCILWVDLIHGSRIGNSSIYFTVIQLRVEPKEDAWMTSRLKKRPAHGHVTHSAAMTTASEQVVARVGKSPSEFHDSLHYYYGDSDYHYGQCT